MDLYKYFANDISGVQEATRDINGKGMRNDVDDVEVFRYNSRFAKFPIKNTNPCLASPKISYDTSNLTFR